MAFNCQKKFAQDATIVAQRVCPEARDTALMTDLCASWGRSHRAARPALTMQSAAWRPVDHLHYFADSLAF